MVLGSFIMPITTIPSNHLTVRKRKEQILLAQAIESSGVEMIPCSRCRLDGYRCVKDLSRSDRSRCSECVRARSSCDAEFPLSEDWDREVPREGDWRALDRQEERLRSEEEEAMAKILRLRKQQKLLRERRQRMADRGLKYLDELDALEEKERLENERGEKEKEMASASVAGPSDDSFAFDSSLDPSILASMDSPSFWVNSGISGEMPPTSQGS